MVPLLQKQMCGWWVIYDPKQLVQIMTLMNLIMCKIKVRLDKFTLIKE